MAVVRSRRSAPERLDSIARSGTVGDPQHQLSCAVLEVFQSGRATSAPAHVAAPGTHEGYVPQALCEPLLAGGICH